MNKSRVFHVSLYQSAAQGRKPPRLPEYRSFKKSTTVLSDIGESAWENVQEPSLVVSAVCRALFISNISSFCRVLSTNWLYFNKILVCLALFLNGLPCWESRGSSLLHSLPSLSPGDLSLPKLQADWDLRHSEKWENKQLSHSPNSTFCLLFETSLAERAGCQYAGNELLHCWARMSRAVTPACHWEFCPCAGMKGHMLLHSHSGPCKGD